MKIKTINDLLSYVETEEKAQRLINYINSLEELCDIDYKEIKGLKQDNEYLNKVNIELSTEKNRLNNIINKALEKLKGLQYRFGYVLDDLVYLLMQGSDKE